MTDEIAVSEVRPLSQIIFDNIPRNPVNSLAQGNVLQGIVFSVFLGLAINFSGEKGKPLLTRIMQIRAYLLPQTPRFRL